MSHPDLARELASLEREANKHNPQDILQFCANFFHRRLEAQRHEFLLGQRHSSGGALAVGAMSEGESNFPGGNPFGNTSSASGMGREVSPGPGGSGLGGIGGGRDRAMQSVMEEEEHDVASPTASSFPQNLQNNNSSNNAAMQDAPPTSNGGTFGNFGFGGAAGTGSAPQQPQQPSHATSAMQMENAQSFPQNYSMTRRTSVSAESLAPAAADDDSWKPPQHPKTDEQLSRLRQAVSHNFLFSHLDDDQANQVLGALQERKVPAKDVRVIVQGDAGDYFYVVESGNFDIYVNPTGQIEPGPQGMGQKVASSGPGQSFGELALMYNAPRAATVVSTAPSILWQLDRVTFRRILMDSAFQRRRMYESFLEEVPLLSPLTPYERSKIADALSTHKYPSGSTIIREGDVGDKFYLLESGEAEAFKLDETSSSHGVGGHGQGKVLRHYGKGDYFGELALLDDRPRAASVVAKSEVKVAALGKDGFQRLLGPVTEIMRRDDPRKMSGVAPA